MDYKEVIIASVFTRPGDRNPNVKVYGIVTSEGEIFETCGNYGNHKEFPEPINQVKELTVDKEITLYYGQATSYDNKTFIGYR